MTGARSLSDLLQVAMEVFREERAAVLAWRVELMHDINQRKEAVVKTIENRVRSGERIPDLTLMRRLIAMARENQSLVEAALSGIAIARRKITAIRDLESGVVAYAQDGRRIRSMADSARKNRSA